MGGEETWAQKRREPLQAAYSLKPEPGSDQTDRIPEGPDQRPHLPASGQPNRGPPPALAPDGEDPYLPTRASWRSRLRGPRQGPPHPEPCLKLNNHKPHLIKTVFMSTSPSDGMPKDPPKLATCRGQPAPAPVQEGWETLLTLPSSTLQAFAELLMASIADVNEEELGQAVTGFSGRYGLDTDAVIKSVQACQFLLRQAAVLDLDPSAFASDLRELSGEETGPLRVLLSRYGPMKTRIRERLLVQTLMDHGKVLVGLDWRVDRISASNRLSGPASDVVILTLELQSTGETERVNIQLPTRSLSLLQEFCALFTSGPQRGS